MRGTYSPTWARNGFYSTFLSDVKTRHDARTRCGKPNPHFATGSQNSSREVCTDSQVPIVESPPIDGGRMQDTMCEVCWFRCHWCRSRCATTRYAIPGSASGRNRDRRGRTARAARRIERTERGGLATAPCDVAGQSLLQNRGLPGIDAGGRCELHQVDAVRQLSAVEMEGNPLADCRGLGQA